MSGGTSGPGGHVVLPQRALKETSLPQGNLIDHGRSKQIQNQCMAPKTLSYCR